jgi:hypothetical protein
MRSRHVRRALLTALAVDTAVMLAERHSFPEPLGTLTTFAGRRLDDLAYGAGLWWGAIRARSPRALMPCRPNPR